MTPPESAAGRPVSRRTVLLLGVGAFAVAGLPFLRRRRVVRRTVPVMGTFADLVVVHENPVYAHAALTAAADELRRVEALMTRFRDDSDVGRLNGANGAVVRVRPETAEVLRAALHWSEATDGMFDPCLAAATVAMDAGRPVAVRIAGRRLYRHLDLDGRRARLTDQDAAVDLGGIAKGYGVDRAAAVLRQWGIASALVNAGGDLYALGRAADGTPWQVGVRNPEGPGTIASFPLEDAAAATSGDYLRGPHLLDPVTGGPARAGARSITVVAERCVDADAGATAAFGLEAAAGSRAVVRGAPGARVISRA